MNHRVVQPNKSPRWPDGLFFSLLEIERVISHQGPTVQLYLCLDFASNLNGNPKRCLGIVYPRHLSYHILDVKRTTHLRNMHVYQSMLMFSKTEVHQLHLVVNTSLHTHFQSLRLQTFDQLPWFIFVLDAWITTNFLVYKNTVQMKTPSWNNNIVYS